MNKLGSILGLAMAWTLAILPSSAFGQSTDPIRFSLHDWTGQLITTHIMGEALSRKGYNVEYVQADYFAQFTGLKSGDLHVSMEIWETTARDAMQEAFATGLVENLGKTGMTAVEDWWYPSYMEETCPGLPKWEALRDCAEAFSTPVTSPKGRYLAAPVSWGGGDEERVKALGLNFVVEHAGSDAALFAELQSAYQRKAPIVLWVWTPHWAPTKFDGKWIDFPKYEPDCYKDPSWGLNPNATHDCGKPTGPIWKVGSSQLLEKWPKAHAAIKKFNFTNEEMSAMIGKIDLDGKELNDVVKAWLDDNQDTWNAWFE